MIQEFKKKTINVNFASQILHGEQYLEVIDHLPVEGKLITKGTVIDVMDKKSGALVVTQSNIFLIYWTRTKFINSNLQVIHTTKVVAI